MTREESKSCIGTIELLRRLAYNIHGVMDVIDADNCEKIIKALEQEPCGDAISKQAIQTELKKCEVIDMHDENDNFIGYYTADTVDSIVRNLPPVTPEPKTGHWKLVQRGKEIDVCCSKCEAVRIKGYAYNYTIDQLNKEDLKECFECADMRYCPNCGTKMESEIEE